MPPSDEPAPAPLSPCLRSEPEPYDAGQSGSCCRRLRSSLRPCSGCNRAIGRRWLRACVGCNAAPPQPKRIKNSSPRNCAPQHQSAWESLAGRVSTEQPQAHSRRRQPPPSRSVWTPSPAPLNPLLKPTQARPDQDRSDQRSLATRQRRLGTISAHGRQPPTTALDGRPRFAGFGFARSSEGLTTCCSNDGLAGLTTAIAPTLLARIGAPVGGAGRNSRR